MKRILVVGGGFAGLWSAVGAARTLDAFGVGDGAVEVTLVDREAHHNIRVRNYEADLRDARVPFDEVLGPIGVKRIEAEVHAMDFVARQVTVATPRGELRLPYDRLVFALGSAVHRPGIPGLAEHGFDVDTYAGAQTLAVHLAGLAARPDHEGSTTVIVVGAGLTGIEVAAEMPARLRAALGAGGPAFKVILADAGLELGSGMGAAAQPVIEAALRSLDVEARLGASIASVDAAGVTLASGARIAGATVVWCAGMRASPLTSLFPVTRDSLGRLPVDSFLRVQGVANVFAAGDAARAMMDDMHASVMSCQHGRPMGRYAGHNAVADLLGRPMLSLRIERYVTCLDLGSWGALYTEGWNRAVIATGAAAKQTKQTINRIRIYPPRSGNRAEILAAAEPVVQAAPSVRAD